MTHHDLFPQMHNVEYISEITWCVHKVWKSPFPDVPINQLYYALYTYIGTPGDHDEGAQVWRREGLLLKACDIEITSSNSIRFNVRTSKNKGARLTIKQWKYFDCKHLWADMNQFVQEHKAHLQIQSKVRAANRLSAIIL